MGLESARTPLQQQPQADSTKEAPEDPSRRRFMQAFGAFAAAMAMEKNGSALAQQLDALAADPDHPEKPKLSFEVLFSRHAHYEDAEKVGMKEKMEHADIFLPEMAGWNEETEKMFNAVSSGKITPRQFFAVQKIPDIALSDPQSIQPFRWAELEAVYKTGIPVSFVDIPENHPLEAKFEKLMTEPPKLGKNFNETLRLIEARSRELVEIQRGREEYMLARLELLTEAILDGKISGLKEKKDVKILMQLGAYHTNVYHQLRRSGQNAKRQFTQMPYRFGYGHELQRRMQFGKQADQAFLAHAFLEEQIGMRLTGIAWNPDEQKGVRFGRMLVGRFTIQDIKQIHDAMVKSKKPEQTFDIMFNKLLKKKNIQLPKSQEEFDKMKF